MLPSFRFIIIHKVTVYTYYAHIMLNSIHILKYIVMLPSFRFIIIHMSLYTHTVYIHRACILMFNTIHILKHIVMQYNVYSAETVTITC